MAKKIFLILILTAILAFYKKSEIFSFFLSLPLEINISAPSEEYFSPNNMLLISLKNEKGVPIGLKKIIDPIYPVKTKLSREDLFLSGLTTSRVEICAEMNKSGRVNAKEKGSFYSSKNLKTFFISRKNAIDLDSKY